MKKKILTGIAGVSIALIATFNVNGYDHLTEADDQGGGGIYVPENCSSSTSCMPYYGTETINAKKYCCSKGNVPTGKAKL